MHGFLPPNAAFVDVKFSRLKLLDPKFRCLAFVEAPQTDVLSLRQIVGSMRGHSDFMAYSLEDLKEILRNMMGAGN